MSQALTDQELRELSRKFLELTSSHAAESAIQPVRDRLLPTVTGWVDGYVNRAQIKLDSSTTPEDARQMVLEALLRYPPSKEPGDKPEVTLMAWVKRVSRNKLIDLNRKRQYTARTGEKISKHVETQDETAVGVNDGLNNAHTHADDRLAAKQFLSAFIVYLDEHYDRGASYMRAQVEHEGATGNELAEVLGVSRANYDKIASRTRTLAVRFREAHAS